MPDYQQTRIGFVTTTPKPAEPAPVISEVQPVGFVAAVVAWAVNMFGGRR